jgi:hypothetical protein
MHLKPLPLRACQAKPSPVSTHPPLSPVPPHACPCLPAGRSEHLGSLLSDDEDDLCDPLLAASLLGPGPSLAADLMPMPTADLGFNFAF